jgi:hypothetical protein
LNNNGKCPDCGREYPKSWNFCTNKRCDREEPLPWADDIPKDGSNSEREEPETPGKFYDRVRRDATDGIKSDMADMETRVPRNV